MKSLICKSTLKIYIESIFARVSTHKKKRLNYTPRPVSRRLISQRGPLTLPFVTFILIKSNKSCYREERAHSEIY